MTECFILENDALRLEFDSGSGALVGLTARETGWKILDPIVAIIVALNIVWTGIQLVRRSVAGLMDEALSTEEQELIQQVMAKYREKGVSFHALRTRQAAARRFISVHILVPGDRTVHDAHHIAEDFENDIRLALGGMLTVFTHLEPAEDEISMDDMDLDR